MAKHEDAGVMSSAAAEEVPHDGSGSDSAMERKMYVRFAAMIVTGMVVMY